MFVPILLLLSGTKADGVQSLMWDVTVVERGMRSIDVDALFFAVEDTGAQQVACTVIQLRNEGPLGFSLIPSRSLFHGMSAGSAVMGPGALATSIWSAIGSKSARK